MENIDIWFWSQEALKPVCFITTIFSTNLIERKNIKEKFYKFKCTETKSFSMFILWNQTTEENVWIHNFLHKNLNMLGHENRIYIYLYFFVEFIQNSEIWPFHLINVYAMYMIIDAHYITRESSLLKFYFHVSLYLTE